MWWLIACLLLTSTASATKAKQKEDEGPSSTFLSANVISSEDEIFPKEGDHDLNRYAVIPEGNFRVTWNPIACSHDNATHVVYVVFYRPYLNESWKPFNHSSCTFFKFTKDKDQNVNKKVNFKIESHDGKRRTKETHEFKAAFTFSVSDTTVNLKDYVEDLGIHVNYNIGDYVAIFSTNPSTQCSVGITKVWPKFPHWIAQHGITPASKAKLYKETTVLKSLMIAVLIIIVYVVLLKNVFLRVYLEHRYKKNLSQLEMDNFCIAKQEHEFFKKQKKEKMFERTGKRKKDKKLAKSTSTDRTQNTGEGGFKKNRLNSLRTRATGKKKRTKTSTDSSRQKSLDSQETKKKKTLSLKKTVSN